MKMINSEEIMTTSENPARAVSWMYITGLLLRVQRCSTKKHMGFDSKGKEEMSGLDPKYSLATYHRSGRFHAVAGAQENH